MIQGCDVANALAGLMVKAPVYEPNQVNSKSRLPLTMRQLVEGHFDGKDDPASWGYGFQFGGQGGPLRWAKIQSRTQTCRMPIGPLDLRRRQPKSPVLHQDHRDYYPLLSAFYGWLKKKRRVREAKIDHPLTEDRKPWPLFKLFERELEKQTGLVLCDLFIQAEHEYPNEESMNWDCAHVPIYYNGCDDDDVPLLEMLEKVMVFFRTNDSELISLPEIIHEMDGCRLPLTIWTNILVREKIDLIPSVLWQKALKALKNYDGNILTYDDYGQTRIDINRPSDIDFLFCAARDISRMRQGVDPLANACSTSVETFWKNFLGNLYALYEKDPTLGQVLADGRSAGRVATRGSDN